MKTTLTTQRIFLLILLVPFVVFSVFGFHIYAQITEEVNYNKSVQQTKIVLASINNIQEGFLNAETGIRGFVITGNNSFLEQYRLGIETFDYDIKKLQELTSDNQLQQQNIAKLKILGDERLTLFKNIIQTKEHDIVDIALITEGHQKMNEIRTVINDMKSEENNTLSIRTINVNNSQEQIFKLISVGFPIIITISILTIIFLYAHMRKRARIEFELETKSKYMKEIDTQKSEFSTMITHELKTPLVPITVYCKMLKSDMIGSLNQEQKDAINVIEKNTKSLDHLINDILDARKLDVKKLKFNLENENLGEFFDGIYSSHNPVITQKGNRLVMNISDKHITVKTDKIRLRQVFDNLISNALKFMPEKNGLIEIGLKKENNNLIFHVKDNGLGIPLDKQSEIFKKFYQVDTSARRKIAGTGLGLAISKGIIEQMGGKIWFESNGKSGTTFFIQLPST